MIRVNSQSGKGGVAYVMKEEHGFDLPRRLQIEFSKTIQHITEDSGTEITPATMWGAFEREYLPAEPRYRLRSHELHTESSDSAGARGSRRSSKSTARHRTIIGEGDGPVEAFVSAIVTHFGEEFDVVDYAEHAIGRGADAQAVAYVETVTGDNEIRWGIGSTRTSPPRRSAPCSTPSNASTAELDTTSMPDPPTAGLATVAAMTTWLRRLFVLAVIAGAAVRCMDRVAAPQRTSRVEASTTGTTAHRHRRPAPEPAGARSAPTAERWREPVDGACPEGYPVKVAKSGIYHVPGGRSYERTTAERCYMNAEDAEADGYRRAKA